MPHRLFSSANCSRIMTKIFALLHLQHERYKSIADEIQDFSVVPHPRTQSPARWQVATSIKLVSSLPYLSGSGSRFDQGEKDENKDVQTESCTPQSGRQYSLNHNLGFYDFHAHNANNMYNLQHGSRFHPLHAVIQPSLAGFSEMSHQQPLFPSAPPPVNGHMYMTSGTVESFVEDQGATEHYSWVGNTSTNGQTHSLRQPRPSLPSSTPAAASPVSTADSPVEQQYTSQQIQIRGSARPSASVMGRGEAPGGRHRRARPCEECRNDRKRVSTIIGVIIRSLSVHLCVVQTDRPFVKMREVRK